MRVIFKWENCSKFYDEYRDEKDCSDAFFVEIPKEEINNNLFDILKKNKFVDPERLKTGEYFEGSNRWARTNPQLANENCAYILINKELKMAFLCDVHYPYAGMWNGYNPFKELYDSNIDDYKNYGIIINNLEELVNIDELIKDKINKYNTA